MKWTDLTMTVEYTMHQHLAGVNQIRAQSNKSATIFLRVSPIPHRPSIQHDRFDRINHSQYINKTNVQRPPRCYMIRNKVGHQMLPRINVWGDTVLAQGGNTLRSMSTCHLEDSNALKHQQRDSEVTTSRSRACCDA